MNEDIDERLTPEEIYLICGEKVTKKYDLTNMYEVCDTIGTRSKMSRLWSQSHRRK